MVRVQEMTSQVQENAYLLGEVPQLGRVCGVEGIGINGIMKICDWLSVNLFAYFD